MKELLVLHFYPTQRGLKFKLKHLILALILKYVKMLLQVKKPSLGCSFGFVTIMHY